MVRKTETGEKRRRAYKERRRARSRRTSEGLRKQLDVLVPPIAVEKKDLKERVEAQAEKRPKGDVSEPSIQKERSPEGTPRRRKQTEPTRKGIDPWGIIIGETD